MNSIGMPNTDGAEAAACARGASSIRPEKKRILPGCRRKEYDMEDPPVFFVGRF
jgi:hypothetical protein